MNWLSFAGKAGSFVGYGLLAVLIYLAWDRMEQKEKADAAARCAVAAGEPLADLADCAKPIANQVTAARQAARCDAAAARDDGRFVVINACGAGVKRLHAMHDAAAIRVANLETELAKARADTSAAVTRAETRAITLTERKTDARKAIEAAPRDGAGRITCDAECLRRLQK